jgi:phosphatidylglycerophosphate synthase
MAASFWAKVKTAVQMIMILFLLLPLPESLLPPVIIQIAGIFGWLLITAGVFFSILSAVEYAVKNKRVFK